MLSNKQLKGPSGKYVSVSEKIRKLEENIFFESKLKNPKVESNEEVSDFECYDKPEGKPVHVDVDEITRFNQRYPILAILPNRSEENNNSETRGGKVRQGVGLVIQAYAGLSEHLNHWSGRVPYHFFDLNITYNLYAGPTWKRPLRPQPRPMTTEKIHSDYDPMENK